MKKSVSSTEPNAGDAISFLRKLLLNGPWTICAIIPDGRGLTARTFDKSATEEIRSFFAERIGRANLYFQVNPVKPEVRDRKAKKEDVAAAAYLYVDIDNPDALQRIADFAIAPTAVVFSGGGYNVYWRLAEPITEHGIAEAKNRWLVEQLDGDRAATDVSRILRLPGTMNLPDKRKRERGREPAAAYVVEELTDWSREYPAETFDESGGGLPSKSNGEGRDVPPDLRATTLPDGFDGRLRDVATLGDDPQHPRGTPAARYPSRSEAVFAVSCGLARFGLSREEIASILLNTEYRISESVLEKSNPIDYALKQADKARALTGDKWPDGFVGRGNIPKSSFQNSQVAMLRLGLLFSFDVFRQRKFVSGCPLQEYDGEVTDGAVLQIRDMINKRFGFDPGPNHTRDAVDHLCNENMVDPVRRYLDGLEWDGVPRLDTWLVDYLDVDDSPYARAVGAIVLIAAVRRVRKPGVKFDTIMVLEGSQGSGKSTAISILASEDFYSDQDIIALDQKAQMEALEGVWIFEICELAGMRFTDINKVKAFASRAVDRARPAYARKTENRPRRGILIGTTNDDAYLKDHTGNRRFWPIRTGRIDLDQLTHDRDQLWAEAAAREAKGESITLPRDLWAKADTEQKKRLEADGWEIMLEGITGFAFGGYELAPSRWILEAILEIAPAHVQSYHWSRLKVAMRALEWDGPMTLNLPDGQPMKGYRKKTDRPDEPMDMPQM